MTAQQHLTPEGVLRDALLAIAACGQGERPDEPEYDCGNSGDVAYASARLAEWCIAQIAVSALRAAAELSNPEGGE